MTLPAPSSSAGNAKLSSAIPEEAQLVAASARGTASAQVTPAKRVLTRDREPYYWIMALQVPRSLPRAEAARALGVSVRTIACYIEKGSLRAVRCGRRVEVRAEDVEALKQERESPPTLIDMNPVTFQALARDIESVRKQVKELEYVWDRLNVGVRMETAGLVDLFQRAAVVAVDGVPEEQEETWAELCLAIRAEELAKITRATKTTGAWRPFLELSTRMHESAHSEWMRRLFSLAMDRLIRLAVADVERRLGRRAIKRWLHRQLGQSASQIRRHARHLARLRLHGTRDRTGKASTGTRGPSRHKFGAESPVSSQPTANSTISRQRRSR